jgi:hypothetical protein
MISNYCKNLYLLFERDLLSGEKKLIRIFQTKKQALLYRRRVYGVKSLQLNTDLQTIAPVEIWKVTTIKDPLYIKEMEALAKKEK